MGQAEEQIERVIQATCGMYGDLQGIAGLLQEIDGLSLKALEGETRGRRRRHGRISKCRRQERAKRRAAMASNCTAGPADATRAQPDSPIGFRLPDLHFTF